MEWGTAMTMAFADLNVEKTFKSFSPPVKAALLDLRQLIFTTAADTPEIGRLVETLKWGQPAYLPARPRVGTTIRLDALKGTTGGYAVFFHCQTTLVSTFREIYRDAFSFEGNRAIVFPGDQPRDEKALKHCFRMALTYHLRGERRLSA